MNLRCIGSPALWLERPGRRAAGGAAAALSCLPAALSRLPAALLLLLVFATPALAIEYTGITRDTFPVFNDPPMLSASQAEAKRLIFPRSAVIGVAHGPEAKAYPIEVMGIHELGNDTIDGIPIAISW